MDVSKYLSELHGQIFAIAFVAGVFGNIVASLVTWVYIHFKLKRHHERIQNAIRNPEERGNRSLRGDQ